MGTENGGNILARYNPARTKKAIITKVRRKMGPAADMIPDDRIFALWKANYSLEDTVKALRMVLDIDGPP